MPLTEQYAALLATDGVRRGLIGPREAPRLWERHLLNCAALAGVMPTDAEVADVGSGAGLPGVVLALARPDLTVTLIEPLLRRATFLEEVVAAVGLAGVRVVRARAENLHGSADFDVVTSRAVAPMAKLLEWTMPLVRPAGAMLAMKGRSAAEEIEAAGPVVARLGTAAPELVEIAAGESTATVVRVTWPGTGPVSWPLAPPTERRRPPDDR